MMRLPFLFCALVSLTAVGQSQVPPAAQLLPSDTIAILSLPDWDRAAAYARGSALGKLWADPAMRQFREKSSQRWQDEMAGPLARATGVKWSEWAELAQGQVTLAFTRSEGSSQPGLSDGVILLVDTKAKANALKTRLAEFKRTWTESGKPLRTETIRGVEFTILILSPNDLRAILDKALPAPPDEDEGDDEEDADDAATDNTPAPRKEFAIGQSGSLLIAGSRTTDIERVLARRSGGMGPALSDQAAFAASQSLFRDALAFGWVDFARIFGQFQKRLGRTITPGLSESPSAPRADKILAAAGLSALKTVSVRLDGTAEGTSMEVFLRVPDAERKGIFRILTPLRKESAPPGFVGADVVEFSRWRIDGQAAWRNFETILGAISPDLSGLLQMGLQAAGKDQDPNFDLRSSLLGSLGDDLILIKKKPTEPNELNPLSSLVLVGSPNPDEWVRGMRGASGLLPLAGGDPSVKEREFLGRTIYSLGLPGLPASEDLAASKPRNLHFAAGGGYAALSTDSGLLEDYLRSGENPNKPLRDLPGLAEAAQKVGGMSTGSFAYENTMETARAWLESAKKENAAVKKLLSLGALAGNEARGAEARRKLGMWLEFDSLPPFEDISKYFHLLVNSLAASEEGLSWKMFVPVPPRMNAP